MQLTSQQQQIIESKGNIKINAVAGSGKTSTLLAYAQALPVHKKILYIAFNKSVKLEAIQKFAGLNLPNVKIETAHSLAFHHIVKKSKYSVGTGYKTHEIVDILGLPSGNENHNSYIIANHVNKLVSLFCNSAEIKVQQVNYINTLTIPKVRQFVGHFYDDIVGYARQFLAKMDKGEILITHDFYLKKFQLSNPQLPYDYLLFDEGQDASPAMLSTFLNQHQSNKVIVGDTHQQIYSWRHAINSLECVNYDNYNLDTSFRFDNDVAQLAIKILQLKKHIIPAFKTPNIIGAGNPSTIKSSAFIARTNLKLLVKAIELIVDTKEVDNLYFEGNINSYTYAEEGASIFDVLNLYLGRYDMIKDKLLQSMKSIGQLEEYIEKTEDAELRMLLDVVKKYKQQLPHYIKLIKDKHVLEGEKNKADIIFSTVHKCKGMEYDEVTLANDFINERSLLKMIDDAKNNKEPLDINKLNEEINILYVAITRCKSKLNISKDYLPYSSINWTEATASKNNGLTANKAPFNFADFKNQYKNISNTSKSYVPWSKGFDEELLTLTNEGKSTAEIADILDRSEGAIKSRLKRLKGNYPLQNNEDYAPDIYF